jgi:glucosylceramidase
MKHFSHFVAPGARRIKTVGYDEEALAFVNPDGSFIVTLMNDSFIEKFITLRLGKEMVQVNVPSGSVNTLVFYSR